MASLNKVMLIGNLTRDPEIKYTTNGMALCNFSIAVNRKYTSNGEQKEEVAFIDIEAWGKQGESCNQYLSKGRPVFIEGRLKFDQWDDKATGKKRSRLTVNAERVQFLGGNEDGDGQQRQQQQGGYQQAPPPQQAAPAAPPPFPAAAPAPQAAAPAAGQPAPGQNPATDGSIPF